MCMSMPPLGLVSLSDAQEKQVVQRRNNVVHLVRPPKPGTSPIPKVSLPKEDADAVQ